MDWHLRSATEQDREFGWRLHQATMHSYVAATWGSWDEEWQRARFDAQFAPARIQILVVDGEDVGVVALERRASEIFLANLQILPQWQGKGLGSAMIGQIVKEARQKHLPVTLQVLKSNAQARDLYERLRFRVVDETPTHFRMRLEPLGSDVPEE